MVTSGTGEIDMDLSKEFPRGPREKLGGMIWLPRMIDKARASLAGTLGEYRYNCVMDARLLKFLNMGEDAFLDLVKASRDDAEILSRLKSGPSARSDAAIAGFNEMMESLEPTSPDMVRRFEAARDRIKPGRTDVTTWVALLDLEEGRLK